MVAVSESGAPLIRCCSECFAVYRNESPFCPSDGGAVVAVKVDPLIGSELEHYWIEELIGEGGMGRVYRARHKTLVHKQYAIKILLGDFATTPAMRARFVNEAKSASRLDHPNVVTVLDVGSTPRGLLYLVMELVDGVSLSELIDLGPMEPVRAAQLAAGVALGLKHAHDLGLVHRDLKPENVLVVTGPHGEVPRIVDFGIALSIETGDTRLTSTGMTIGTPGYVAPEQVSGNEIDARADQYALGVTLFEMLTGGRLPFEGDPIEVVAIKASEEAPRIDDLMPDGKITPPGLARIVAKMIARWPNDRFGDAAKAASALDLWIRTRGVETTSLPKSARTRRFNALVVAISAAVLLTSATAIAWMLLRSPETPSPLAAAAGSDVGSQIAPEPAAAGSDVGSQIAPEPAAAAPEIVEATAPLAAPDPPPFAAPDPPPAPVADPLPTAAPIEDPPPARSTRLVRPKLNKPKRQLVRQNPQPAPVPEPAPIPAPVPVLLPAPPPKPAPIVTLEARLLAVAVEGSLSEEVVRRAVDRVRSTLLRCTSTGAPHAIEVHFTIDESRRSRGVRASGAPAAALECVRAAFEGVRTETAPDIGDASVVVRVGFKARS